MSGMYAQREQRWRALEALRDEVVAIVASRSASPTSAEDDVHEAMARLVQRPELDLDPTTLRTLLITAARGIAVDGWRRRQVHDRAVARLALSAVPAGACVDDVLVARTRVAAVAETLPTLATLERAALYHAVRGRRPGEAAALLGVGYKSLENALTRARRKLREKAMGLGGAVSSMAQRLRALLDPGAGAAVASALAVLAIAAGGSPRPVAAAPPADHPTAPAGPVHVAALAPPPPLPARQPLPVALPVSRVVRTAPPAAPPPPWHPTSSPPLLPSGYVNTPVASTQPSQQKFGGRTAVVVTLPVTPGPTTDYLLWCVRTKGSC